MTVGIVGAGITGLSLAHALRARGVPHVCLEAGPEPGGVIRSREVEGRVLELGPQRLRMAPGLDGFLRQLGLGPELIQAEGKLPLYVYFDGRLREAPFSLSTFLATDLLSGLGKLRLLAEPLVRGRGDTDETAADFFRRKFGTEAYENFLGPLFGGIYGSDPRTMYAKYALSRLLALQHSGSLLLGALRTLRRGGLTAAASFRGGMQALPRALHDADHENIHLDTPVHALRRCEHHYTLVTPRGDVDVDSVVLTAPADRTAELLRHLAPDAAERLARLAYNPLAIVHLHSTTRRKGLGYQIRGDQEFRTLGVTWNAGMFDERDGIYTAFLGGSKHPDLIDRPENELRQIARTEFETIMDAPASVLYVHRWRRGIPAYDLSWVALDGLRLPPALHLATNYTGGVGVSARIREAHSLAARLADARAR